MSMVFKWSWEDFKRRHVALEDTKCLSDDLFLIFNRSYSFFYADELNKGGKFFLIAC